MRRHFESGVETAYKAVMKPVEGTILTVAKDAAKRALQAAEKSDDIIYVMEEVVRRSKGLFRTNTRTVACIKGSWRS